MLLSWGLGPNLLWGIALRDSRKLELEFKRLQGSGVQGPLEASGKRGQNTHRASSVSLLIVLSLHTVDYCLSYKLFQRRGHGHGPGLATQWPNLSIF
ncbi:LOW QUALITY PROTEIN: putative cancer susceptibility gene HEPN1 protein [Rhinolophus ferrumequinum]|uniref:LOW QUALITY PROTEIN: putative cancer susceptibility gene HEPN1 protein n=1 Tax=Rhinolophus ferrumequinum TaxID=59479 RepID=UPI00140FCC4E|nr:LOW QUALITY PROTEIN: putative cancer susceptibility gene HEPN1 protein [Rhinolophus ferrumequinum]